MTALGCLALLFAGILLLPRSWFWFWWIPLALAWLRLNHVMLKRERLMAQGGLDPAGADGGERRVRVLDRLE